MLYFYFLLLQADVLSEVFSIHNPKKSPAFVPAAGYVKPFVAYFTQSSILLVLQGCKLLYASRLTISRT